MLRIFAAASMIICSMLIANLLNAENDLMESAPTETLGIESSTLLGSIELGRDFEGLVGRNLRAREVHLEPGAIVGVHPHEGRPAVVYILEGEMTEYRSDEGKGLVRRKGDVSFEETGMAHWWRNDSGSPALLFVVDIVPESELH
jgi:quercetin dioxygenase-like cupin family protein